MTAQGKPVMVQAMAAQEKPVMVQTIAARKKAAQGKPVMVQTIAARKKAAQMMAKRTTPARKKLFHKMRCLRKWGRC